MSKRTSFYRSDVLNTPRDVPKSPMLPNLPASPQQTSLFAYSSVPPPMYHPMLLPEGHVYPPYFQSPHHQRKSSQQALRQELKSLGKAIVNKQRREQEMINNILSMADQMGERKQKPKHSDSLQNDMLTALKNQQDAIMACLLARQIPKPSTQQSHSSVKEPPQRIQTLINDLDSDDEDSNKFEEAEKRYFYDPNLSEEHKNMIIDKINAERRQREIAKALNTTRKARIKGKRGFKIIVLAVIYGIAFFKKMRVSKENKRVLCIQEMEDSIDIYLEVTKVWVKDIVRAPLYSLLKEKEDMDIVNRKLTEQTKSSVLKLQVKIKAILEGLISISKAKEINSGLKSFLGRLASDGTFLPANYLLPYEKSRLQFSSRGALADMNRERKRMLIGLFIISRVIIQQVFLVLRTGKREDSAIDKNITILCSLLQYIVITSFARVGRPQSEWENDKKDFEQRKKNEKPRPVIFI